MSYADNFNIYNAHKGAPTTDNCAACYMRLTTEALLHVTENHW